MQFRKKIVGLWLILVAIHAPIVHAETINLEVSGNGAGSSSTVQTSSEQKTEVSQSNSGSVDNNVQVEANTGNNQVNSNTSSDVNVQTGDVAVQTEVSNQTNTNSVDLSHCCDETQITQSITGNGAESTNAINSNFSNTTNVNQHNAATINNTIITHANTGNNTVSKNTGSNIEVTTGDIKQVSKIHNQANSSIAVVPSAHQETVVVTIKKNGAGSTNSISTDVVNNHNFTVHNIANVSNYHKAFLNTGNNNVSKNTAGNIWVKTGDILSYVTIVNDPINTSTVVVPNCCSTTDPDDPDKPGDDDGSDDDDNDDDHDNGNNNNSGNNGGSNNSNGVGGTSSDNGSGGSSSGSVLGAVLPDTGFDTRLFLYGNLLLLLSGITLRYRLWEVVSQDYACRVVIRY